MTYAKIRSILDQTALLTSLRASRQTSTRSFHSVPRGCAGVRNVQHHNLYKQPIIISSTMATQDPPEESFTKMSVGDVEAIGAHCQMPFCRQLDFLPFKCESCKGCENLQSPCSTTKHTNRVTQKILPRSPNRNRSQLPQRRRLGSQKSPSKPNNLKDSPPTQT